MRHDLHSILDLEQIGERLFRGRTRPTDVVRVFGGEVAGQALVAAARTVPADRSVHSLHAYFLRPGDPSHPIVYRVDATRDGRSFSSRRVVGLQHGEKIFNLAASFHVAEDGGEHQLHQLHAPRPDDLPPAEVALEDADARTRAWYAQVLDRFPVEMRFPEELPRIATVRGERRPPQQRVWLRALHPLPDEPLMHVCAATYLSDLFLLAAALPPHRMVIEDEGAQVASLDHAVWFHADFRADDWLLYDQHGLAAGGARVLCRGSLFDRRGRLVATVMQEGLVRKARAAAVGAPA